MSDNPETEHNLFSNRTQTSLKKFNSQMERLQSLGEDNPVKDFLSFFPFPFAMLDEDLKYILHSNKWAEVFETPREDLTGEPLQYSGFHVSDPSLELFKGVLSKSSQKKNGKDMFLSVKGRRIHIHWMVWEKEGKPSGLILIANLHSTEGLI